MKTNQIKSIVHDLIEFNDWKNPIGRVKLSRKYKINLLTGKLNLKETDSITELLEEKRKWFKKRIEDLKGDLNNFQKAEIIIKNKQEKVSIIYKQKLFEKQKKENYEKNILKKIRKKLENLKPNKGFKVDTKKTKILKI